MRIMKSFSESIESEKEIMKFCQSLTPNIARDMYDTFKEYLKSFKYSDLEEDALKGYGFEFSIDSKILSSNYRSKLLNPFFEFIRENEIFLKVFWRVNKDNMYGRYFNRKKVEIYWKARKPTVNMIVDLFRNNNQESRIINGLSRIIDDSNTVSSMIHEFAHAYDDFISNSKYRPKDYKSIDKGDSWGEYASQNLEVNARYTSAIAKLEKFGMRYTAEKFLDILEDFKYQFEGWKELSKDQQERILKRLYAWFTQPITNKNEQKKALKYIYNNASYRQLYQFDGDKNNLTNKVEIPKHLQSTNFNIDLISYLKESAMQLIRGNFNKKEFNTPTIVGNRYIGFKAIGDDLAQIAKFEFLALSKEGNIKDTMLRSAKKKKEALKQLAFQLGISEDSLEIIASRFTNRG